VRYCILRPDAPLIRYLSKAYSPALGQEYARLPLFLIPQDLSLLVEHEQDLLAAIGDGEDALHLPYPDVLLDFPAGAASAMRTVFPEWPLARGQFWVRVRTVATALRQQHMHTFSDLSSALPIASHATALLEAWEEKTTTGGFPPTPDCMLVPLDSTAKDFRTYLYDYPNPQHPDGRLAGRWCNMLHCTIPGDRRQAFCAGSELVMSPLARLTILALAYLTAGVSLTVRVRPEGAETLKPHVAREKPWLVPRTHYILIDPERLRDYGHPASGEPRGTHRAPVPHARRGHWRRLPEGYRKRQTWVRPAWVGATEWSSGGQVYRILDTKNEQQGVVLPP